MSQRLAQRTSDCTKKVSYEKARSTFLRDMGPATYMGAASLAR